MGRNGRRRAVDRDREGKFLGCGMGFMPYLHAPHHEGIPIGCSTSGGGTETIAKPPLPTASKQRGYGGGGRMVPGFKCIVDVHGDEGVTGTEGANGGEGRACDWQGKEGAVT